MQIEQQKERERLKSNRKYFEDGCSCIHTSKTLQPCPTTMADDEAVAFYEQNCKCSRNYLCNDGFGVLCDGCDRDVAWVTNAGLCASCMGGKWPDGTPLITP